MNAEAIKELEAIVNGWIRQRIATETQEDDEIYSPYYGA